MYTPKDKRVSVTLTPYMYYNWGDESIRYIEKGNEHPDPFGKLYWGWGLDENGEVGLLPGDYVRQFEKIGNPVTFTVTIPGESTWGAMQERAYVGKAIRRKVGQLIDQQYVVQLRKVKRTKQKKKVKK
jgi:hypothetical protein